MKDTLIPSSRMTSKQRRTNADATLMQRCFNICVTAGFILLNTPLHAHPQGAVHLNNMPYRSILLKNVFNLLQLNLVKSKSSGREVLFRIFSSSNYRELDIKNVFSVPYRTYGLCV